MDVTENIYPAGIGQAYCLYRRRPYGRRHTNSLSGRTPNPNIQRCNPQKERTKPRQITKQK